MIYKNIKIAVLLLVFIFLLSGCSKKAEDYKVSQKKIEIKPVVKKKEYKKAIVNETDNEDPETEFDNDEDDDKDIDEDEFDNEFDDKEEKSLESKDGDEDFDPAFENTLDGRIKKVTLQPKSLRADSDIEVFINLIPGLDSDESILINFRKGGTIEIANSSSHVFKKELFKKGDIVSFDIMLIKDENIIEERRLQPALVANSNPKITLMPSITTDSFKVYTYDVRAEDIDGDSINFELKGDVPPGMQIDDFTGRITYNFNTAPPNERYKFKVIARDTDGGEDIKEISLVFKKKIINPAR